MVNGGSKNAIPGGCMKGKINENDFEIDKMWKTVNFNITGRGIVGLNVFGQKKGDISTGIIHSLGMNNEGPREKEAMLSLKKMRSNHRKGGSLSLYHADSFEFETYCPDKLYWKQVDVKENDMSLFVDLGRNVRTFIYQLRWSKGDMFGPMNSNTKYFTKQTISCKMKKLVYQLAVGRYVVIDGLPQLSKIDKDGNETVLRGLTRRPEPADMALFTVTDDCTLCNYYFAELYSPEIGSTYKITWGIKTTKLDRSRYTDFPKWSKI